MLFLLLPAALAGGHADLQAVLSAHVSSGKVDYPAMKASEALDSYVAWLAAAPEPAARADKMAFWINAYNALTIDMMADEWPVGGILELDGGKVWDTRKFTVAGKQVSLNDIEHKILRPMGDARIHAAVNCASKGCPPLSGKAFTGAGLEGQLAEASERWMKVNGVKVDVAGKSVTFNKIFDWYGEDFVKEDDCKIALSDPKQAAAACFAAGHVGEEQAAFLKAGGYEAGYHPYSWKPNSQ